jgi:hypothetical protein
LASPSISPWILRNKFWHKLAQTQFFIKNSCICVNIFRSYGGIIWGKKSVGYMPSLTGKIIWVTSASQEIGWPAPMTMPHVISQISASLMLAKRRFCKNGDVAQQLDKKLVNRSNIIFLLDNMFCGHSKNLGHERRRTGPA